MPNARLQLGFTSTWGPTHTAAAPERATARTGSRISRSLSAPQVARTRARKEPTLALVGRTRAHREQPNLALFVGTPKAQPRAREPRLPLLRPAPRHSDFCQPRRVLP
jgi:hypothetical protein